MVSDSPSILKSALALGIQVGSAVTLQGRTHLALNVGNTEDAPSHNTSEEVVESSITDLNWLITLEWSMRPVFVHAARTVKLALR